MKYLFLVTAGLFLSQSVGALAQDPPATVAQPVSGQYRIAPDDLLNITVLNFPTVTTQTMVTPDGSISVPLLGQVSVTGQTIQSVTASLTRAWSKYIVNPSVSVSMVKKHAEEVIFSGYVTHPGPLDYRPGQHLLEALASSGGPLATGDMSQLAITHADGTKQTIDASHPERLRGTDRDVLLNVGDVVYIPEQRAEFSVVGEVTHPGSYGYKDDMTVLDALTAVAGPTELADLHQARLTRSGQDKQIDLDALLKHGDMSQNLKMAAGDRIIVPESHNRTYIYGAVGLPGYYIYKPGDRLLDALKVAGGYAHDANISDIHVVHVDPTKNVSGVQTVDLKDYLERGKISGNMLLQPGDAIYIPEMKQHTTFGSIFQMLSGLNVVNQSARALNNGIGR